MLSAWTLSRYTSRSWRIANTSNPFPLTSGNTTPPPPWRSRHFLRPHRFQFNSLRGVCARRSVRNVPSISLTCLSALPNCSIMSVHFIRASTVPEGSRKVRILIFFVLFFPLSFKKFCWNEFSSDPCFQWLALPISISGQLPSGHCSLSAAMNCMALLSISLSTTWNQPVLSSSVLNTSKSREAIAWFQSATHWLWSWRFVCRGFRSWSTHPSAKIRVRRLTCAS